MTHATKKKPLRKAYRVQALSWEDLSPHLRRIVFHSDSLSDYPFQCHGAHVKIFLPIPGQKVVPLPDLSAGKPVWPEGGERPIARTYTLRWFDRENKTLAIDFVKHGDNGPASRFASAVKAGDSIGITSPAGPVPMLKPASEYRFAADLSALPAVSAMVEDMDAQATGLIFLWLPEATSLPVLPQLPVGIRLQTFFGGSEQAALLVSEFCKKPATGPDTFIWLAGEAGMVAPLRKQVREVWQLPVNRCYAVPYWRSGDSEESYHHRRHEFMDN